MSPLPRIVGLALAPALAVAAQDPPRLVRGALGARVARYVEQAEAFGFSGAVLTARGGRVIAALGVGAADLAKTVRNDANTLFELASVTKQFTAAAILRLRMQGALQLDDPIAQHLPGVPDDCSRITIRHLLQHTSGIPATNDRGYGDDLGALLSLFLEGGPRHPPGTRFEYWNQGYALLAGIVQRTSGAAFTDFCRRELFAPAGLRTACFTGDAPPDGVSVAVGRSPRGAPRSALEHPYGSYGYQYLGMGGAVANVWDLWRWDRALCSDAVLDADARRAMLTPGHGDYALGWYVRRRDGRLVQSHGGSVRGFVCDVRRFPEDDAFLCVLCNRTDAPFGELANALEDLLFGEECDLPGAPLDAGAAQKLVGTWQAPGLRLVVEPRDAVLAASLHWEQLAVTRGFLVGDDLAHVAFYDWNVRMPITVRFDADGAVAGLRLGDKELTRR